MKIDADQPSQARISMSHGTTVHGLQLLDDEKAQTPTSYYNYKSGVGIAILNHPKRLAEAPIKIGVVGLGAGTLSAYARPHDEMVFYEINPLVIRFSDEYFSFRRAAQNKGAKIDVRQGDARLLLEQELKDDGSRQFDVLVVDAFSSDSIPVHLLTRECFDLYWQHIAPGGVLAVHVSNRHLNLQPVVFQHAQRQKVPALFVKQSKTSIAQESPVMSPSEWIVMTTDSDLSRQLRRSSDVTELDGKGQGSVPEWTDNYSSLWELLR